MMSLLNWNPRVQKYAVWPAYISEFRDIERLQKKNRPLVEQQIITEFQRHFQIKTLILLIGKITKSERSEKYSNMGKTYEKKCIQFKLRMFGLSMIAC